MSTGLRELTDADLDEALERVLVPRLSGLISTRRPGHCVRVSDVPAALAARVCRRVRGAVADVQAHVLGAPPTVPDDVAVTGTKLVELRNPDPAGRQRPPLLVFIPPGTHASAEDSFGVATFEEADLGDVYADLMTRLLPVLPEDLRRGVTELFAVLDDQRHDDHPMQAGSRERARFLLTVTLNDNDAEAAGAALFELGLVPDFELFGDPEQIRTRVTRNARHVRTLLRADRPIRQRVIDLRLTEPDFRAKLAAFLTQTGLDDPQAWARRIVMDPANWGLSFHRWPLPEDRTVDVVQITVGELSLPRAGEGPGHDTHPILGGITGLPYLPAGPSGHTQLPVAFEVSPDPRRITGLARFSVQLISEESGPTGVRATVQVSVTGKSGYKATLRKLRTANLETGWHYVEVQPLDSSGVPLPLAPTGGRDADDGLRGRANQSERFYVVSGEEVDEPPPQPRVRKSAGVTQELIRLAYVERAEGRDWRSVTCRGATWQDDRRNSIKAGFGAHGHVEIAVSPVLAEAERAILGDPTTLAPWRLATVEGHSGATRTPGAALAVSVGDRLTTFLQAREGVFAAARGEDGMILAGRNVSVLREAAVAYAQAYGELLTWQLRRAERGDAGALRELAGLLRVDSVTVEHRDARGAHSELVLVAPTHPLRLLWLVTWAELGQRWLRDSADSGAEAIIAAERTLSGLVPSGFPLVVPREDGRFCVAAGTLTPYWGVLVPAESEDPRSLLAEVAACLGLAEGPADGGTVSPVRLADQLERYLRMHPYVQTLVVCVVNAGRAELIADMLIELEGRKPLRHLCYDVRLFAADPQAPGVGAALSALLRGEWSTKAEAEAFCVPAPPGRAPKLAVAVRPVAEFRSATSGHAAHVTLLFDAFSGERFGVGPEREPAPAPIHGLVQDMTVEYVDDEESVAWHKRPRHGAARELADAEELSDVLAWLPATISTAAAAVSSKEIGAGLVPRVTLSLTPEDSTLLHQAHRSSDWVITVDRTLGVEYFDSPGSLRRPDYVIDFTPQGTHGLSHHVVVSSRSVDELRALLTPMIEQHGFQIDRRHAGTFFDQLRLLSGRLAFKIASTAPTQRTEVLGLALARLYLDYQGVLADQILLPLDSHLELYREARRRNDAVAQSAGLHRTDLALFTLDARRRTITCRLVEVKCLSSLGGLADLQKVRAKIEEQLNRSATVLAEIFDPAHAQPDRPDRVVRNAELAALLRFYLGRAERHGVMHTAAAEEARWLLDRLDWGYRFEFTRTGLIFDLGGQGTDRDSEGGIEFHRIGRDLIEELIDAVGTDPVVAAGVNQTSATLSNLDLTLARVPRAAFRAPSRTHDIPRDEPRPPVEPDLTTGDETPGPAVPDREAASDREAAPARVDHVRSSRPAVPIAAPERHVEPVQPVEPVEPAEPVQPAEPTDLRPDVYIGSAQPSPQYGLLGEVTGRHLALDLNETHTISLFGVQGGGKSYTLGSIIEAATLPAPPVNELPHPLATIVFHYSPTLDYAPEFTSMVAANDDAEQAQRLSDLYGVRPAALSDVVMLVPEDHLDRRRAEYPAIEVLPLKFGSGELRAEHWRFLMGAIGNQSTYIRQLQRIMKANRNDLRLDVIRQGVADSTLSDNLKQLAQQRLDLAADYIDDAFQIKPLVRPGRMIIVDLRDEFIEKDEALGLFVVLMQLFAEAQSGAGRFNKLVVFDEAHKYIESPDLVAGLVESVREMRHKGMSVLVASQDPPSVPISLIELSDHVILHKFTSPAWLKHLQKANAALADLTPSKMASLTPGEAYVWAGKATDAAFTRGAIKVRLRPRITRHGGGTRTAVEQPRARRAR